MSSLKDDMSLLAPCTLLIFEPAHALNLLMVAGFTLLLPQP
jgi:hypothetical protein